MSLPLGMHVMLTRDLKRESEAAIYHVMIKETDSSQDHSCYALHFIGRRLSFPSMLTK